MATNAGTVRLDAAKVARQITCTLTVKMAGMRRLRIRARIGMAIIWLGVRVMGMGFEVVEE